MAQEIAKMTQESASELITGEVDEFYFSALFDGTPFPISDSQYAEELQLQEALMTSSVTLHHQTTTNSSTLHHQTTTNSSSSSLTSYASSSIPTPPLQLQILPQNGDDHDEVGESSQIFCEICAERKPTDEMFKNDNNSSCKHSFCSDCIGKHIATKLVESSHVVNVISCPGLDCKDVHALELESCRETLPREVVERWDEALCEALILSSQKFYCPFKDCSAVLVNDSEESGEIIVESECPICHRLFCARCRVPWHSGIGCDDFQRLNEDERGSEDLMVRDLAMERKWKRCPECMFYVERTEGCLHITCRCAFEFCYGCGSPWTQTHGGCQRD